ncbi:UDP-2,4-diacetamido-2,4,6-trideoxy-beta-L-altropyranose hydrolase [Litorivicinus sp.]|nr:UDP-2,4-diacetamido-2,4,6-trideoxy-beta-L-altropyranose hydrolase [Litorivicinus sp.]
MKIIFRADASRQIGHGHVLRCLTLAKALRNHGAECRFICREHTGNLIDQIRQEGFKCTQLPMHIDQSSNANDSASIHSAWIGSSWRHDAHESIHTLGAELVDWLIVDHYGLDKRWESIVSPHVKKIMVIDDLADRHHDCDLLLDQNLVANFETRYQNLVPEHCGVLLAPKYALLQPEYAELRPHVPMRSNPIRRILVFFSGADQHNLTGQTVSSFLKLKRNDIKLDVVVGSTSPYAAEIQELIEPYANITLHDALPSLAPLILKADLAIGGGGATSWERCCLGLPSLVITLAENQKPIAAELHRRGLVNWLGHYDAVTDGMLRNAIQAAIDHNELEIWSKAQLSVTDGNGVKNVVSVLALNSEANLKARHARPDDSSLLLRWVNDPLVRANSFNSEAIVAETHQDWLCSRLRDPEHFKIYIVETDNGLPIGQVRFELIDDFWTISYSLDRFARGLKLGKRLIETALLEFRIKKKQVTVVALVKKSNTPSNFIFDSLGFEKDTKKEQVVYRRTL